MTIEQGMTLRKVTRPRGNPERNSANKQFGYLGPTDTKVLAYKQDGLKDCPGIVELGIPCGRNQLHPDGRLEKFITDHIDGDCTNNKPENLRDICYLCNQDLPTTSRTKATKHDPIPSTWEVREFISAMIQRGAGCKVIARHLSAFTNTPRGHSESQVQLFVINFGLLHGYQTRPKKRLV